MSVRTFAVDRAEDVNGAIDAVIAQQSDILFVTASPANLSRWPNIIAAAREYKILTFGQAPGLVRNGCAMYCGPRLEEVVERSASFVDRVLRGAKIGELPVELPTRFDLTLNLKALSAIGLRPSREILLQTTEVIE
jgi:putative ABC transport system substrate-binding protein